MKLLHKTSVKKKYNSKKIFNTQNYTTLLLRYNQNTWIMKKNYYTTFLELNDNINKKLIDAQNASLFTIITKENKNTKDFYLRKSVRKMLYKPLFNITPVHKTNSKLIIILLNRKNRVTFDSPENYYNKSVYVLCPKKLILKDKTNYDKWSKKTFNESLLDYILEDKFLENIKKLKELSFIINRNISRLLIPQIDMLDNSLKKKPLLINYTGKDKTLLDKITLLSRNDKLVYKAKLEFVTQYSLELHHINKTILFSKLSIGNEPKTSTYPKNVFTWKNLNPLLIKQISGENFESYIRDKKTYINDKIISQATELYSQDLSIKLLSFILGQIKITTLPKLSLITNLSPTNTTPHSIMNSETLGTGSKSIKQSGSTWSNIIEKFILFISIISKIFVKKPLKDLKQVPQTPNLEKSNEVVLELPIVKPTKKCFKKNKKKRVKKNITNPYKNFFQRKNDKSKSLKHIDYIKQSKYYPYKPTNKHPFLFKESKYTLTHFDKLRYKHSRLIKKQFIKHTLNYYCIAIKLFLNLYQGMFENYNSFFINFKNVDELPTYLTFNFTRNKFFPVIRDYDKNCFFFSSIGILARRFNKGKSTYKTKQMYLASASLLRKILIYTQINKYFLIVKKIPTYLLEIINTILNPVVKMYKHPFGKIIIDEKKIKNPFNFHMIYYYNNKPYNFMKTKKKHTLKRKITRRVFLKNRVADIK